MRIKKVLAVSILIIVVAGGSWLYLNRHHETARVNTTPSSKSNAQQSNLPPGDTFNKQQYSMTDPTSQWVIVNKQHPLNPADYKPSDLVVPSVPLRVPGNESMQIRKITATALQTMFAAAQNDGINLMLSSGYRSYDYQTNLYGSYVKSQGQAVADTQSARPGYSEHQTGLALDVEPASRQCEVEQCFATTPEGKWVAANAYKYGFIIRYPADKVTVTGYEFEPWHIRFIGTDLATQMHNQNIETLEEFFNVTGGTNY